MPVIDHHEGKEFDAATKTKLDIFENYLTEWLPTFLFSESEVNVCDFFAGPGIDISGNHGSPLRIFNVLEKFEDHIVENRVQINVVLNEKKKKKLEALKANIFNRKASLSARLNQLINVQIYNDDFQVLFPSIERSLIQGPNLFFFDQNGVKQMTLKFILHLETFYKTDYLFFLSSSYFKRFGPTHLFPDLNIQNEDIDSRQIHRIVVEKFRQTLPEYSRTKLYHFSIKKNHNIYGLVFGATHLLAVEKFLKVAWNENKINGEANFDIDQDLNTQMDLFTGQPEKISKIERFENGLKAFSKRRKRFTNEEVFIYTLDEGFTPKHAREALIKLRNSKYLSHFAHSKIGYKQIYNKREIIRFEYIK